MPSSAPNKKYTEPGEFLLVDFTTRVFAPTSLQDDEGEVFFSVLIDRLNGVVWAELKKIEEEYDFRAWCDA